MSESNQTNTTCVPRSSLPSADSAPASNVAVLFADWTMALAEVNSAASDVEVNRLSTAADRVLRRMAEVNAAGAADVLLKLKAYARETVRGDSELCAYLLRSMQIDLTRMAAEQPGQRAPIPKIPTGIPTAETHPNFALYEQARLAVLHAGIGFAKKCVLEKHGVKSLAALTEVRLREVIAAAGVYTQARWG